VAPVSIEPEETLFTGELEVRLSSRTPGVDIRYTLDGSEPTVESPLYAGPLMLEETTRVRGRAFRPGATRVPGHLTGTEVSLVTEATYARSALREGVDAGEVEPGLIYSYFEIPWQRALLGLEMGDPMKEGVVEEVPDIGSADRSEKFALEYVGYFAAPRDGVYTFYDPRPMYDPEQVNLDPGYDLQVWIGDEQWYPGSEVHGFGNWSIALAEGLHPLRVRYADFRGGKPELGFAFAENRAQWNGDRPELQVSGPRMAKRPLADELLRHAPR